MRFWFVRFRVSRWRERPEDDAVLSGRARHGDASEMLTSFVSDLEATFVGPSERAAGAHRPNDNGDPAATPGSNAHGPAVWQAAGLPNWRKRRTMFSTFVTATIAKVCLGVGAATAAVGGAGAAGVLPTPVQDAVADAAGTVGLELPDSHDDAPASNDPVVDDDKPIPTPTSVDNPESADDVDELEGPSGDEAEVDDVDGDEAGDAEPEIGDIDDDEADVSDDVSDDDSDDVDDDELEIGDDVEGDDLHGDEPRTDNGEETDDLSGDEAETDDADEDEPESDDRDDIDDDDPDESGDEGSDES